MSSWPLLGRRRISNMWMSRADTLPVQTTRLGDVSPSKSLTRWYDRSSDTQRLEGHSGGSLGSYYSHFYTIDCVSIESRTLLFS
jgi:hypothetical protein